MDLLCVAIFNQLRVWCHHNLSADKRKGKHLMSQHWDVADTTYHHACWQDCLAPGLSAPVQQAFLPLISLAISANKVGARHQTTSGRPEQMNHIEFWWVFRLQIYLALKLQNF